MGWIVRETADCEFGFVGVDNYPLTPIIAVGNVRHLSDTELVFIHKRQFLLLAVIPAKAGIQYFQ